MKKRKMKLVHKSQIALIRKIIMVNIIFFVILSLGIAYITTVNYANNKNTVTNIEEAILTENNIVSAFIDYSKSAGDTELLLATKKIEEDHAKSMKAVNDYGNKLKTEMYNYILILLSVMVVFAVMITVLFYVLRRSTGRVYGPVYAMSRNLKEYLKSGKIIERDLRARDEFGNLHKMIITLMKENNRLKR